MASSQDQMLDILRRTVDEGYLDPILQDQDSADVLGALTAMLGALQDQANHVLAGGSVTLAPAGAPGTTQALLTRDSGSSSVIPAGTGLTDTRGVKYVVQQSTPIPAGALNNFPVNIATLRKTELVNTVDPPILSWVDEASLGLNLTSTTANPVTGGSLDYLGLVGRERGSDRQSGELTEDYRARTRNIPDAISPIAIAQAARGAAQTAGLPPVVVLEPIDDDSTQALDNSLGLGSFQTLFWSGDGNVFAGSALHPLAFGWDDPQAFMVSRREAAAYFKVTFPVQADGSTGLLSDGDPSRLFLDDGFWDDPFFGFPDVYADSAVSPTAQAGFLAMYDSINVKRAAGVQFDIEMNPYSTLVVSGHTSGSATVFSATPPAGKLWWLQGMNVGETVVVPGQQLSGASNWSLTFTFEDSSTLTTPQVFYDTPGDLSGIGSTFFYIGNTPQFATQRVTQIDALLQGDGVDTQLIGVLRVLEVAA